MNNASIAIQVVPKIHKDKVLHTVDEVIAYIKSTGLNVFVGPYETTIDGEFEQLLEIIKNCQLICIKSGATSVMSYIKFNYSPKDGVMSIEDKVSKHHK